MSDYEGSIVIDRSPGDVWGYVADLAETPRWRTSVRSVVPPEVMAAGASFEATTHLLGRHWRWQLILDEFDPPKSLTYSVSQGFTDLKVTYRLSAADGGCRFTLVASSEADTLAERLLQPIASRVLRRQTRRHLANLKVVLGTADGVELG